MTLAALIDLGVPLAVVERAVQALGIEGVQLRLSARLAGAIGALHFDVEVSGSHAERTYAEIDRLIEHAPLDADVRALARAIFRRLAEAESQVHRVPIEEVHFHEVGAVDAIVDIVGAAACLRHIGARVVATPVPLGRGSVDCRHGRLPLPAPATVLCLRGVPTYDAGVDAELVTPTGAAIVATAASEFVRWPSFAPERVGWGRGSRDLPDRPNVLRAVLGRTAPAPATAFTHVLLEANVDDMTGELTAHAIGALLETGALDAWAAPITMKKGRPALTISALCEEPLAAAVTECLLRETTTIGVRRTPIARSERPRQVVSVETSFGPIAVKVSAGPHGPPRLKPEFDACAEAARRAGVSVMDVIEQALAVARARLG